MVKADDQGDYFRVPLDARSLEYELYFDEGERGRRRADDYTSENTERLDLQPTKELLLHAARDAAQLGRGRRP